MTLTTYLIIAVIVVTVLFIAGVLIINRRQANKNPSIGSMGDFAKTKSLLDKAKKDVQNKPGWRHKNDPEND